MPPLAWAPIALLVYYLLLWASVARRRKPGVIAPRYAPPAGLSAAAVRYATFGGCDGKTIAAALAQLAGAGTIRLTRAGAGFHVQRLAPNPNDLPREYQVLLDLVFAFGDPAVLTPGTARLDGL